MRKTKDTAADVYPFKGIHNDDEMCMACCDAGENVSSVGTWS